MLFNSYIFIFLFLPLVLLGYYTLNHFKQYRLATVLLVGMSFWFYGYNNIAYVPLLLISVCMNYLLAVGLNKSEKTGVRRLLFAGGLLLNLGVLFFFKYYGFTATVMNDAFGTDFVLHHLILPLGISFYTFQQLSYIIDSYKKEAPLYPFLDYAAYVTFFPQLIAGPIVLHEEFIPQLNNPENRKFRYENFAKGLYAFSLGLAKKVLLADVLSKVATPGFSYVNLLDTTNSLIVLFAYTFQLYFDFSGYCDMAYGIGYMFNIELPQNFRSPYKATNQSDFWKRWHITLSRFFTRYIYFPLGGSRKGKARALFNLFLVFFVSAIWHGAGWTYIIWGILCGGAVVVDKVFEKYLHNLPRPIGHVLTYLYFVFTLIAFRCNSVSDSITMLKNIFSFRFGPVATAFTDAINRYAEISIISNIGLDRIFAGAPYIPLLLLLLLCQITVFTAKNTEERVKAYSCTVRSLIFTLLLLIWSILSLSEISEFLYFNF